VQCAAFDPSDGTVAAGDATGRIIIWHDLPRALQTAPVGGAWAEAGTTGAAAADSKADGHAPPARTTLHWHAHAVGALSYSMDGASLLSGGQEGVLVRVLALRCGACSPQQ
jgi:NET1-associated nuclear protein 1 (U3 small nucleolar RNA-associated protein 17)